MSNKKEIWKEVLLNGKKPSVPYVISNHGRFGVKVDGKIVVRTFVPTNGGYRYNVRQHGINYAIFIYKEVAKAFLKKPSPAHKYIIHKDHDYLNNHVDNLRWAKPNEHRMHTLNSPRSIEARTKKAITGSTHSKLLSEKQVIALKKMIWDPKRKLSYKLIADKFGVSEMQIYRIKSGEFWYHIKVENEPVNARYKQNLINISYQEKKAAKEVALAAKKAAAKKAARTKKSRKK